jgi:hypothetical protein
MDGAMIALVAARQILTLAETPVPASISFTANLDELPGRPSACWLFSHCCFGVA